MRFSSMNLYLLCCSSRFFKPASMVGFSSRDMNSSILTRHSAFGIPA
ncbi:unnamed protein product [Ixodes pacificus]